MNIESSKAAEPPRFEILTLRQFAAWMADQHASLSFTNYQAGKTFLPGLVPDGRLDFLNRIFERLKQLGC